MKALLSLAARDRRVYLLAGVAWLVFRIAQIALVGWGSGQDYRVYLRYAAAWGGGQIPYVDFHPEYPPAALVLFLVPFLVVGRSDYPVAFSVEMLALDLCSYLLVLAWSRRVRPGDLSHQATSTVAYLILSAVLFPTLLTRFDLAPALLAATALYLSYDDRRSWLPGLSLGLGGMVKLWPLLLTPATARIVHRRAGARGLVELGLGVAAGLVTPLLLFWPRAGVSSLSFLSYHAARGLEIGSTWAAGTLLLRSLGLVGARVVNEYGAWHVRGDLPDFLASISPPVLLGLALLPLSLGWRRVGGETDGGRVGALLVVATILGSLVGSKVLSPQYLLWLVPLIPMLLQRRAWVWALFFAVGAFELAFYPYLSPYLIHNTRYPHWGLAALLLADLALASLYVVSLHALWTERGT